jgi:hypothetical protein
MVHEEMDTVPLWTETPPPCKQQAKREMPMGAMGNFQGLCVARTACV